MKTDYIADEKPFSTKVIKALAKAGITTLDELRNTSDYRLSKIRNVGAKGIAIIDAAVPDRIKQPDGETEMIAANKVKKKIDTDARRILRFMEYDNLKLSELMKSDYRLSGKRRARKLLLEYCDLFPERIEDVLKHFEALNDTSDKFYKELKQLQNK